MPSLLARKRLVSSVETFKWVFPRACCNFTANFQTGQMIRPILSAFDFVLDLSCVCTIPQYDWTSPRCYNNIKQWNNTIPVGCLVLIFTVDYVIFKYFRNEARIIWDSEYENNRSWRLSHPKVKFPWSMSFSL